MDAESKAKYVTQLRKEADYWLDRLRISDNDAAGVDQDALLQYVERWRQVTLIMGPSEYPSAYYSYGHALSQLGLHYSTLADAFENALGTASDSEKAGLEAKLAKYRNEARKGFAQSNRQIEIYLQNSGGSVNPAVYKDAVGNCQYLQEYSRAITYLDLLEGSGALSEQGKQDVAKLREQYKAASRRDEEKQLERELNQDRPSGSRGPQRVEPESAN